ncbi:Ran-binding protein M-like protein [Bienertia sinuspersici]
MVTNQQEQISSYFLEQARLIASSSAEIDTNDDEDEPLPTELNTINSSGGFLVASTDKLSVQYTGVNLHGHDVGVIQANYPAPVKRLVYYFEMTVKNAGTKGQIAIGFTNESFKMRRQPGFFH